MQALFDLPLLLEKIRCSAATRQSTNYASRYDAYSYSWSIATTGIRPNNTHEMVQGCEIRPLYSLATLRHAGWRVEWPANPRNRRADHESSKDSGEYEQLAAQFSPVKFDADENIKLAEDRYEVHLHNQQTPRQIHDVPFRD